MEDTIRHGYQDDADKAKALNDLACSIIGSETTEEGAVDKLSVWVRNHVSYSLGVSTDPLDVVKSGRAYCEGYASLMVALMREIGIPARTEDCYIAPGNDWGFSNDGGNHAFVAYYYPGIGWLCLDPQSSAGYVDPFHLVGFSGTVYDQYRQTPDVYVTGYADEPKAWEVYTAAGKAGTSRGFAIRLRGPNGNGLRPHPYLAISKTELEPSNAYFEKNILGKPWCVAGDDKEVNLKADATRLSATLGDGSGWQSYFALPGTWPGSGKDMLAVKGDGFLGLMKLELDASSFVTADFDFSRGRTMRIRLRDPASGKIESGQAVHLSIDGSDEDLRTGSDGFVSIYCVDAMGAPLNGLIASLKIGDSEYSFTFQAGVTIVLPEVPQREGELQAALASARTQAATPQLRLVVRDRAGTADASIVRSASIFDGAAGRRLSIRDPGFLVSEGLEVGKNYTLRATIAGINVQRQVGPIESGPGPDIEIRLTDLRPAVLTRANPFDTSSLTLYEYFDDRADPWPLIGESGLVRWDCPPGSYLLADNASRVGVMSLPIDADKEVVYAPASMDLKSFNFAEAFHWKASSVLSGRIKDDSGPIRSGKVVIVDPTDLSMTMLSLNASGFFSGKALRPAMTYTLAYADSGRLLLHTFTTDSKGGAALDLSLSDKGIPCCTYDYQNQNASDTVYLLFTAMLKGNPALQPYSIQINRYFDLHVDDGSYLLSTEKTIMGASIAAKGVIDGQQRDGDAIIHLGPNGDEPGFIERSRNAATIAWPGAAHLAFVRFSDKDPYGWKSATVDVQIGDRALHPAFDSQGFFQFPAAAMGSECSFSYSRCGLYWEGRHTFDSLGPEIIDIAPDPSKSVRVGIRDGQTLCLLRPSVQSGQLKLGDVTLSPDSHGSLTIVGQDKGVWLRAQDGSIRFCEPSEGVLRMPNKSMPDQAQAWESLLRQCDSGGTHRVIDLRGLGTGGAPRFSDENAKSLSAWSPLNGLYVMTGLTGASLNMDLQRNGLFVRQSWRLSAKGSAILLPRSLKAPSFVIKLSGPSYKIRNAPVALHSGGSLDGGAIKGDKAKVYLNPSTEGRLVCAVPDGLWWIETCGQFRKVSVTGSEVQAVTIEIK
jgi:hypothetical protein